MLHILKWYNFNICYWDVVDNWIDCPQTPAMGEYIVREIKLPGVAYRNIWQMQVHFIANFFWHSVRYLS